MAPPVWRSQVPNWPSAEPWPALRVASLVDRLDDCARTDLPVGEDVGAQAPPVDQAAEHALRGEAFQVGARLTQALAEALDVSDTKPTSDQKRSGRTANV